MLSLSEINTELEKVLFCNLHCAAEMNVDLSPAIPNNCLYCMAEELSGKKSLICITVITIYNLRVLVERLLGQFLIITNSSLTK